MKTVIAWGNKAYLVETEENLKLENIKENIYKGNTIYFDNKKDKIVTKKKEIAVYIKYNDIYIISRVLEENSVLEDVVDEASNVEVDRIEEFLKNVIDITDQKIQTVFEAEREKNAIEHKKREAEREKARIEKRRKEEEEKERKIKIIEEDIINGDAINNEKLLLIADYLQVQIPIKTRGFIKNKLNWITENRYSCVAGSKSEKVFEIFKKIKEEIYRLNAVE